MVRNSRLVWLSSVLSKSKSTQLSRVSRHIVTSSASKKEKLALSYDYGEPSTKLMYKTIGQALDETTETFPDTEAVVFSNDDVRLTYFEFTQKVNDFACGLVAIGLKPGERIGIWGQNHLEWLISFYAACKAGLIVVNVNPANKASELKYAINKVGMKALLMMPKFKLSNYYDILSEIAPEIKYSKYGKLNNSEIPTLRHVVMTEGQPLPGTFSFEEVNEMATSKEKLVIEKLATSIQADWPVNVQFTSGTTGNPKGATLSHHNLVNNGTSLGNVLKYSLTSKVCIPVPLYHSFGLTIGSINCLLKGATQVYPSRGFNSGASLKAIHNERCTSVYGTPVMFIDMLNHPDFNKYDYTSLETGIMAGSPCPVEVMQKVITEMHCKEITCAYGLTETSPTTNICSRDSSIKRRTETVGKVMANCEMKVIDGEGSIVPINVPGELCFRGYLVFQGYWDDEVKTKEAIDENGWFHSGDLGVVDEEGFCRIVGRLKDMIIRGGENIYPAEIENFFHKHPKIVDVQVFGVPDARMGEEVCAWIKLKPNVSCTEDELRDFCKGKISHFKIPRYFNFVDEFPLTVTEKVKKFEMARIMTKKLEETSG